MTGMRVRIGGDGPVVAESDSMGWRLIVRGSVRETGSDPNALHSALRHLALSNRALAEDAFGVVMNCMGAWEDEYTDEHGEDALRFEDWIEHIEQIGSGWATGFHENGELYVFQVKEPESPTPEPVPTKDWMPIPVWDFTDDRPPPTYERGDEDESASPDG